jgi:hypothetical protein
VIGGEATSESDGLYWKRSRGARVRSTRQRDIYELRGALIDRIIKPCLPPTYDISRSRDTISVIVPASDPSTFISFIRL